MRIGEAERPMAMPSYFLIDKQGIVRGKWIQTTKDVFPSDAFLEIAREIEKRD